nr:cytidine deaminase [uncultured Lichenicoccus sp.]
MADPLIEAAVAARQSAHAPYSRFLVGAALRCDDGSVHAGCNVENAAYPQGVCAEAGAISAMVLAGSRRIVEIVIAARGGRPCTPCGGCRQKMREFAGPEAVIRMVDEHGAVLMQSSLDALLPHSFGPEDLGF